MKKVSFPTIYTLEDEVSQTYFSPQICDVTSVKIINDTYAKCKSIKITVIRVWACAHGIRLVGMSNQRSTFIYSNSVKYIITY